MFKPVAALLFSILLASPALATNELAGQTLAKVEEMAKAHGVTIEKLNDADTATIDAVTPPRPKPSEIYLLWLNGSVILALVHDGVLTFSSDPAPEDKVNKILNRSGA